ncbi:uncharacterized protein [Solanum lycopersicum]|uniref:uncharacterized protein n=1 Tax=Solanum lycopersicum TaxID=4081 RepID=UPI00374A5AAD
MDFVVGLPKTRKMHDSIWVIVYRMTKSALFIPLKSTYRVEDYAKLYIDEIVSYYSSIGIASFDALYGRGCRSPVGRFEVGESAILGLEIIHEVWENVLMIRDRLATTYSCKKSYGDNRKRALEFEVGDQVFLRISPMKGVIGFVRKRSSFQGDPTFFLTVKGLGDEENLSYEEVPVEILDHQVKKLRNKDVSTVKKMNTRRNAGRRVVEAASGGNQAPSQALAAGEQVPFNPTALTSGEMTAALA